MEEKAKYYKIKFIFKANCFNNLFLIKFNYK